ncbi:MAG: imidazoleglycerol-phosphate dehydratase HisB [Desulfosarcinaceae bacterium]|nr:imidazoleglycerol-phosphate dehydratase HisB [Desulfosarcinaceae bacterium]
MTRIAEVERKTKETQIRIMLDLHGQGDVRADTGIGFFDHMLTLLGVHAFFDLAVVAQGDLEVDYHHTVEDVGLGLGTALQEALGDRKGIRRYGFAVTPMDESLAKVAVDISNRPYLVLLLPDSMTPDPTFDVTLIKEFMRALSNKAGMNLHIEVPYGENQHHVVEAVFKSLGRALAQAVTMDARVKGVRSSKGSL